MHWGATCNTKRELFRSLLRMGDIFDLEIIVRTPQLAQELEKFSRDWVPHEAQQAQNPVERLHLTSMDAAPTSLLNGCPAIQPLIQYFQPHVAQSYFLRLGVGGFIAPSRARISDIEPDFFQLIVPIKNFTRNESVFLFGDSRHQIYSEPFFLNPKIPHALYSFAGDSIYLFCDILLNEQSVAKLKARLSAK